MSLIAPLIFLVALMLLLFKDLFLSPLLEPLIPYNDYILSIIVVFLLFFVFRKIGQTRFAAIQVNRTIGISLWVLVIIFIFCIYHTVDQ